MSIKKQLPSLSNLYTLYEEVTESFLDENDVYFFYHIILDIALIDNWIVPVSKGSDKKRFAFELIRFCNLKNQQSVIPEEEVSVSYEEIAANLNTLRQFLKQNNKVFKFPSYHLLKPKQDIGFSLLEEELFAQFFQDIKEHCNRQVRPSFCLEILGKSVVSPWKQNQIVGDQNVLTEIINLRQCEVYNFYKSRYCIAPKCGIFDSNFDMWLRHCSSCFFNKIKV